MSDYQNFITIDESEFDQRISANTNLSVLVFYTDWCGSYHMLTPILKDLSNDYRGRVSFFNIDFEKNKALVEKLGIRQVPTTLILANGKIVDHFLGVEPKTQVANRISKWI